MLRDESQMTCFPVYHLVGCNILKEWWKKYISKQHDKNQP